MTWPSATTKHGDRRGTPPFRPPTRHARPILHNDLVPKTNRWHPAMLRDDYLRKLKQDLAEADQPVSETWLDTVEGDRQEDRNE